MRDTGSRMWKIALAVCGIFIIANTIPANSARAHDVSGKAAPKVDKKKPTVKILQPKKNAKVLEDSVLVNGSASDNVEVASVWWRVNGGSWQPASGTKQWTATVPLISGANTVEVYSQDAIGNVSTHASLPLTNLKGLLHSYWPMHDGDVKDYTGAMGASTITFENTGTPQSFDMIMDFDDADSEVMHYQLGANDSQLLLTGLEALGYSFDINPSLIELDATLLDKGGSKKSSAIGSLQGTNIPINMTVSVKNAGTVTVPAGTYTNCKQVSDAITARVPGFGAVSASSENYYLARGVGAIKVGVFQVTGTKARLVGWQDLVSGTVGGFDVTTLVSASARKSGLATGGSPAVLGKTSEKALPQVETQTPSAVLEFTRYDDGESQLALRGKPGCSYVIEAGAPDENGGRIWMPVWTGELTENVLSLSVPNPGPGMLFRARER